MKILYIVRHGKSSWDHPGINDVDRPLKERGINDGYTMANRIRESLPSPEILVSSDAARACHTALIFKRVLEITDQMFRIDHHLYHAGVEEILDVVYALDDGIGSAMIFGHNPGFTDFANYLCGNSIDNVPTTGLVYCKFETDKWTGISRSVLVEDLFDFPKNS